MEKTCLAAATSISHTAAQVAAEQTFTFAFHRGAGELEMLGGHPNSTELTGFGTNIYRRIYSTPRKKKKFHRLKVKRQSRPACGGLSGWQPGGCRGQEGRTGSAPGAAATGLRCVAFPSISASPRRKKSRMKMVLFFSLSCNHAAY